jgi:hypothetical protein
MPEVMTEFYGSFDKEKACWMSKHEDDTYCMKPVSSTTPAHTVDGMKVKSRVVYCYMSGDINREGSYDATASILRDLMRLQGQEPMSYSEYEARYQRTSSNGASAIANAR